VPGMRLITQTHEPTNWIRKFIWHFVYFLILYRGAM
jgi:hypothetical protein